MIDQFLGGVGQTARNLFTPNAQTPAGLGSSMGIHMAIVVDDIDDYAQDQQIKGSLGRVWVYIPGISARNPNLAYARYTPTREPRGADGAPGKPIPEKRSGFIMAYPLTPHSGSDRVREQPNQPDGRNPEIGQSNSYGDFAQARNGDLCAVAFLGGDPGKCYIIGHIPKTNENQLVPGLRQGQTTAQGDGTSSNVGPAYNKGSDNKEIKPMKVFFDNLTDSGLIQDPLRGCGSSASDRETPSRVRGSKTAGDPDTGMNGHQMVMDDHPDSQMMRMRTSKGAQFMMSDTGDFIYTNTATGKVWMEQDDSGNLHVYAHSSINYHTEQDFNFTCDRDLNFHVGGNVNMLVKGDTRARLTKGANITVGEGGGDLDITAIHNMHFKVQEEIRMGAQKAITIKTADAITMQSAKDMNMKSGQKINAKASGDYNMDTGSNMNATKGSLSVSDGQNPNQADMPLEHSVASPPRTDGPPISPKSLTKYITAVVPQHEPWMGHRGRQTGHDAAMSPSSIPKLL